MTKHFKLTSCLLMSLCAVGCMEEVDNDRVAGMLSVGQSGLTTLEVYDLGKKQSLDITIYKGGLVDNGGSVTFTVDTELLDSLNIATGASYKMLPADCYTLEQTNNVPVGGNTRVVVGKLTYDPHAIYTKSGSFDTQDYVLALRATSTGTSMNSERATSIYGFIIKEAIVKNVTSGGYFVVEKKNDALIHSMNLDITTSFPNEWDLQITFAAKDEQYVEDYNTENGTEYKLLPTSSYTLPKVNLAKGANCGTAVLTVDGTELAPGFYMLPISLAGLNGQGDVNINIDSKTVTHFTFFNPGIDRSDWTIEANTEELTGESKPDLGMPDNGKVISLLDGRNETFWHSAWSNGEVAPPYEIIVDMQKATAFKQIGFVAREGENSKNVMNIEVYASDDKEVWTSVNEEDWGTPICEIAEFNSANKDLQIFSLSDVCNNRYVRIYIPAPLVSGSVGYMAEMYLCNMDN